MRSMVPKTLDISEDIHYNSSGFIMGFSGWMDGGEVSTGTMSYIINKLEARKIATIEPEPYYIYSVPGPMEINSLFRPHVKIVDGLIERYSPPENSFYLSKDNRVLIFTGKEPNLSWQPFCDCILYMCELLQVPQMFFVGSIGGMIPHTRDPYIRSTASNAHLRDRLQKFGIHGVTYSGPASFVTLLSSQAARRNIPMASLVAEIPAYVQGNNPRCIDTMVRLISRLLNLPISVADLDETVKIFEEKVTQVVQEDDELSEKVAEMEKLYDEEAFERDMGENDI